MGIQIVLQGGAEDLTKREAGTAAASEKGMNLLFPELTQPPHLHQQQTPPSKASHLCQGRANIGSHLPLYQQPQGREGHKVGTQTFFDGLNEWINEHIVTLTKKCHHPHTYIGPTEKEGKGFDSFGNV